MTNGWVFDSRSGVQYNNGPFQATAAPQGVQTGYLKNGWRRLRHDKPVDPFQAGNVPNVVQGGQTHQLWRHPVL